jgi:hypothetical protein
VCSSDLDPTNPIKDAFSKIKQDMLALQDQIVFLSQQIEDIKRTLQQSNPLTPTQSQSNQTNQQINPAIQQTPTDNLPLNSLKQPISGISTGNGGVPTDSQTDSQTDQQNPKPIDFYSFHSEESTENQQNIQKSDQISQIQRVSEVLESLDSIKKEIRSNFKHLTSQEMQVFSAVYTFEEQGFVVDYSLISQKLGLSESSIRDYTHKLIKKGIPILKSKENNKKVSLSISPELKKIASLQTILTLRKL